MAPDGLSGVRAEVRGSDMEPVKLLSSVLSTIGCSMDGGLRLHLGAGGRRLSVFDPVAGYIWPARVLAMNCLIELKSGGDLALPYDAPLAIDRLEMCIRDRSWLVWSSCPDIRVRYRPTSALIRLSRQMQTTSTTSTTPAST